MQNTALEVRPNVRPILGWTTSLCLYVIWCKGFIFERQGSGWMVLKGVFGVTSESNLG